MNMAISASGLALHRSTDPPTNRYPLTTFISLHRAGSPWSVIAQFFRREDMHALYSFTLYVEFVYILYSQSSHEHISNAGWSEPSNLKASLQAREPHWKLYYGVHS